MKRNAKMLASIMCIVLIGAGLAACGQRDAYVPEPEAVEAVAEIETPGPEVEVVETPEMPAAEDEVYEAAPDEEIVAAPVALESPAGLSDDIYSFEFSLNGAVFSLPFEYAEIHAHGWVFEDSDAELGPNQRTFTRNVSNSGNTIGVSIGNLTPNVIQYYDGHIGGVTISERHTGTGTQFVLAGGVTIGTALEDVIATYGEPSEYRESDTFRTLTYSIGIQSDIRIQVSQDTGLVTEIQMTNFIERQQVEFDGTLPEIAQGYVAPTALGSDWTIGIVELNGDLYQLPAPVGAFLANGWELVSDNEMLPAGNTRVMRDIRSGNQVMRANIKNYDRVEQPLVDGFVTTVEFSHHFWVGNIALPGGITENSTYDEVMAVFGEYRRREESGSFTFYEFGDSLRERVNVAFRNEDGSIHSISMEHDLRDLPW